MRPLLTLSLSLLVVGCDPADEPRAVASPAPASRPDTGGEVYTDVDYPLCINEFMPANKTGRELDDGTHPDWIELFNAGETDISLDRWVISDDREDRVKHRLDAELVVPAGGALVLVASGLPELGPEHLGFKLSREGGEVVLFEPDGDGQVVEYGLVADDFSVARKTDCCTGADCLDFSFRGTDGISNVD